MSRWYRADGTFRISGSAARLCTIKRHRLACRASCGTRGAGLLSIRARAPTPATSGGAPATLFAMASTGQKRGGGSGDGLAYQVSRSKVTSMPGSRYHWAALLSAAKHGAARVVHGRSASPIDQDWRGAGDGRGTAIRPLALGLHAQVSAHFLEGGVPPVASAAQTIPESAPGPRPVSVSAQQSLCGEFALGVSNQDPAQGHGRLARAIPDRRLRGEFHRAGSAVVPGYRHLDP